MSSWLARHKKPELLEMAHAMGLKDTSSAKKAELEIGIDECLRANPTKFAQDPRFFEYYKRAASPVKVVTNSRNQGALFANSAENYKRMQTEMQTEMQMHQSKLKRHVDKRPEASPENIIESTTRRLSSVSLSGPARELISRLSGASRSLAQNVSPANLPLPDSPSKLRGQLSSMTTSISQRTSSIFRIPYLDSPSTLLMRARNTLSTIPVLFLLLIASELYSLWTATVPMLLLTHIPSLKLPLLHTTLGPYGVRAPDLTLLLTTEFWGPMLAYALPGLLLPALAGYLCNFTAKKAARSSWTKSLVPEERRVRRLGANASGAERAKHRVDVGNELAVRSQFVYGVDPLVFGLVRAGMVWAAMERRVAGDHLGLVNLERARAGLMGGTGGVVLGSLAVVVCVVYETILRA